MRRWDCNVSTDRNEWFVFLSPWDARELVFVERDITRDDDFTGLRVVALVPLVLICKAEIDAFLDVPRRFRAILLLNVDVRTTAEDAEHGEIRLLVPERLERCLPLDCRGGSGVEDC